MSVLKTLKLGKAAPAPRWSPTLCFGVEEGLFRTFGAGDPRRAAAIPLKMAGIPGPPAELAPVRADTGSCGPKTQALQWIAAARQP